jgi:hypothetical protein
MYERLRESTGDLLGYAITDRLTREEVEEMQGEIRRAMDRHGTIRMLLYMEGLERVEPSAVWQDLKMTPEYAQNIERMAVVGDRHWHSWMTSVGDVAVEAEYFESGQLDRAWQWVRGP